MAHFFNMPTLGQSMEEGTVVKWFKQVGDAVKPGDMLVEVMSDKANFEVESETEGVLRHIFVESDGFAAVNTPIAIIGAATEAIESMLGGSLEPQAAVSEAPTAVSLATLAASQDTVPVSYGGKLVASPRARRVAEEKGIPLEKLAGLGSGIDGRIVEADVLNYTPETAEVEVRTRVTPLAAKIAGDLGVNTSDLASGLPGSRITADVVRRHAKSSSPAKVAVPGELTVLQVVPFRGLKKLVADNVAKSRQSAPHVTLTSEVDMTDAIEMFSQLRPAVLEAYGTKLTFTDLIIKACARALAEHPLCNAALVGDEIRIYSDKNIGVAVATETSLIVPVIRNADQLSLGEISVALKGLVQKCRDGKQSQDDISGGTFSITNLGSFGIDQFDPIIVPPQSCILGVCRIVQKPSVRDGQIVIRSFMNLCLSFDHRVLDGAPSAKFLQTLRGMLEKPVSILV